MNEPFLSICIPSYNRPNELRLALNSIDCSPLEVEVVISEDFSSKRYQIQETVSSFIKSSNYQVNYYENPENYGFDQNLRKLIERSTGKYIVFLGDDDLFVEKTLDHYIEFLKSNPGHAYVLRSYLTKHSDGRTEYFRYLPKSQELPAGECTVGWLFKRSVSLSGFTILREKALSFSTPDLDGTLLYQVYLMAQICLCNSSIYCDIPFTYAVQTFRTDYSMFGNSVAERLRFTPGTVSHENSINFTKAYFEVTTYIDKKNGTNLTSLVRTDLSKYSYPFLSIQRKRGVTSFLKYAKRLEAEAGFGVTKYFYVYKWALVFLGEKICDSMIIAIKRIIGYTPKL
jgi:abequosyltransferase